MNVVSVITKAAVNLTNVVLTKAVFDSLHNYALYLKVVSETDADNTGKLGNIYFWSNHVSLHNI